MRNPIVAFVLFVLCRSCTVFEVWDPNYFDTPPTAVGPYSVVERRVEVEDGADGSPFGITVFEPSGATGSLPMFIWVMGSNVQAYYHQSLHEILASWGYLVAVPDTRPLTFCDARYHWRNTVLGQQTLQMGIDGALGAAVDPSRIGVGGYSIGATMAGFVAGLDRRVGALVFWAPSGSPIWNGIKPEEVLPDVTAPSLFLLAELDDISPKEGWPTEMQMLMGGSSITEYIIPGGLHLFFQQPTGADTPDMPQTNLTRFEQQGIAIQVTRDYLDEQLSGAGSMTSDTTLPSAPAATTEGPTRRMRGALLDGRRFRPGS
jgi:dienelactone hydrolase